MRVSISGYDCALRCPRPGCPLPLPSPHGKAETLPFALEHSNAGVERLEHSLARVERHRAQHGKSLIFRP